MNQFDDINSLTKACKSYPTLYAALDQRHDAFYNHGIRLQEFTIMGKLALDVCGNASPIEEPDNTDWVKGLPPVLTKEQTWEAMRRAGNERLASVSSALPSPHLICPCCGKGWDLSNFTDYECQQRSFTIPFDSYIGSKLVDVFRQFVVTLSNAKYFMGEHPICNDVHIDMSPHPDYPTLKVNATGSLRKKFEGHDGTIHGDIDPDEYIIKAGDKGSFQGLVFKHTQCHAAELFRETKAEFEKAFKDAGIEARNFIPIENRYGSVAYNGPWFTVETPLGTFTVGWRKRVIDLTWPKEMGDLSSLFVSEDVTMSTKDIHCWGNDKLTNYLKRIAESAKVAV